MCRYLSGIVFQSGELSTSHYTDSHESLIKWRNLDDSRPIETRTWIRVEFSPQSNEDYDKPEKYIFNVDERSTPIWFNSEMREKIIAEMTGIVKASIIKENKKFILGGKWILSGKVEVDVLENSFIVVMLGTSRVGKMWGTSQVGVMLGTSRVGEMRETSQVGEMRETSQVGVMRETSQVGVMLGTSKVGKDFRIKK